VVTAWVGSANSRLGLQKRESMPLLMYFAAVGGVLTTLLLVVNFMLEPSKPERSKHAATDVETSLRKARTTTGFMPSTVGVAATAPAAEARHDSAEIAGSSAQPANQQASRKIGHKSEAQERPEGHCGEAPLSRLGLLKLCPTAAEVAVVC
jgi:hypothetical protein